MKAVFYSSYVDETANVVLGLVVSLRSSTRNVLGRGCGCLFRRRLNEDATTTASSVGGVWLLEVVDD